MSGTMFSLRGRVALVTGASSGIGAEAAKALGAAGADVALVGRDEGRLSAAGEKVATTGAPYCTLARDLCADDAPAEVVEEVIARFGSLDVIVHAAGVFEPVPFDDTTMESLDRHWAVNVRAPYRLTQAALKHLSNESSVIFVSSIAGHVGFPGSTAYCASKGAVEQLVKALAIELAPSGIRVNAVAPGNIHTSMNEHLFADPAYERAMLEATPAGRIGVVEDIAPAIVYLAAPASRYMHGASLLIDGGWTVK